jgi:hypothetical protein
MCYHPAYPDSWSNRSLPVASRELRTGIASWFFHSKCMQGIELWRIFIPQESPPRTPMS